MSAPIGAIAAAAWAAHAAEVNPVTKAGVGAAVWGAVSVARWPEWRGHSGAEPLVLFAALVLLPLIHDLVAERESTSSGPERILHLAARAQLPAAGALAIAYWLPVGVVAAVAALPWLGLLLAWAAAGAWRIRQGGWSRDLDWLARDFALIFSAPAGLCVMADRLGLTLWRLDAAAFAPMAAYFLFAGVLLPLFAGLAQRELFFLRLASRAVVGVVLGVPAAWLGMLATKAGFGAGIEAGTACGLALAGMAVAVLQVRLAVDTKRAWLTRGLLTVSGAALFLGMVVVAVRGMRFRSQWLSGADPRGAQLAVGLIVAVAFGLGGVLAWRQFQAAGTKAKSGG